MTLDDPKLTINEHKGTMVTIPQERLGLYEHQLSPKQCRTPKQNPKLKRNPKPKPSPTPKQSPKPKPIKKGMEGVLKYKYQKSGGKPRFYNCELLDSPPAPPQEGYKWIKYTKDGKIQQVPQSKLSEA